MTTIDQCPLCQTTDYPILWKDAFCRVVLIEDADYPAYCRVELIAHIKEMSDLKPQDRAKTMKIVFAVETAMREVIQPDKINLASLGNHTPHVHWHVVPRFNRDKHFPNSHWGAVVRHNTAQPESDATLKLFAEKVVQYVNCALSDY